MATLSLGIGGDGADPQPPQPDEARFSSMGTFKMLDRETQFLIAAPHGKFDEFTGEMVSDFCERVAWDCLIAEGFRQAAEINVNRPTEGLRLADARFTARSTLVYAKYVSRIRRLSPGVRLYVELHGNDHPETRDQLEIATVGVSVERAREMRAVLERIFEEEGLAHVRLRIDVLEDVRYAATHARQYGTLSFLRPAMHIELPRSSRTVERTEMTNALVRALPEIAARQLER